MGTSRVIKELSRINYKNKLILAPMVRIGFLPMRLLALKYGADIVYSDEILDNSMYNIKRVENKLLNTVDFVRPDNPDYPIFRTSDDEKGKVVFQMGTSDPCHSLRVAKMLENDVAAIDINMGCPKDFSTNYGMGAGLLDFPEKIEEILTTLVKNLTIPVTCKIRILPEGKHSTIELAKRIEGTGIEALAVHGRTRWETHKQPADIDCLRGIADALSIPVIANGGSIDLINSYQDIEQFREMTNASSVMIARAAQFNCSIFRKEGKLEIKEVMDDYLKLAIEFNNYYSKTKYALLCMIQQSRKGRPELELWNKVYHATSLYEICEAYTMTEYFRKNLGDPEYSTNSLKENKDSFYSKQFHNQDIIESDVEYTKKDFISRHGKNAKQLLVEYTQREHLALPKYQTVCRVYDQKYCSVLEINGKKYRSTCWRKRRSFSEQSAAVVCLQHLGLDDGKTHIGHTENNILSKREQKRLQYKKWKNLSIWETWFGKIKKLVFK